MKNKQQSNSITLNLIWQFVPLWKIHLCRGHCNPKPDQSLTISNQSQAFSSLFLRLFLWPKPQTFCSLSPFLIATDHFHFLFTPPVDSVFTQLGNWELKTWMFTAKFHRSSVRTKLLCHSLLIRSLSCLPLPVLYPQVLGLFCPRQTARPCPAAGQLTGHCQPHLAEMQKCRSIWMVNATIVYRAVCRQKVFRQFSQIIRKDMKLQSMGQTPNCAKYQS